MTIEMTDCPRYEKCSAPICPLDRDWKLRSHHVEDRVCIWLMETTKPDGVPAILEYLQRNMDIASAERLLTKVCEIAPEIVSKSAIIKNRLIQASKTGSSIRKWNESGKLLKEMHANDKVRAL